MSKLVILITSRAEEGHKIGEAWYEAGAPGVTFIESYGIRRMREMVRNAEILPGLISMMQIMRDNEETSLVVMSVVEDEAIVERLLAATEDVLGDLEEPNTGVAFVLDVARTVGLRDHRLPRKKPPAAP